MSINGDSGPVPELSPLQQLLGGAWSPSSFAWHISKGESNGQPVVFLRLETVIGRIMLVLSHNDTTALANQLFEKATGLVLPPQ